MGFDEQSAYRTVEIQASPEVIDKAVQAITQRPVSSTFMDRSFTSEATGFPMPSSGPPGLYRRASEPLYSPFVGPSSRDPETYNAMTAQQSWIPPIQGLSQNIAPNPWLEENGQGGPSFLDRSERVLDDGEIFKDEAEIHSGTPAKLEEQRSESGSELVRAEQAAGKQECFIDEETGIAAASPSDMPPLGITAQSYIGEDVGVAAAPPLDIPLLGIAASSDIDEETGVAAAQPLDLPLLGVGAPSEREVLSGHSNCTPQPNPEAEHQAALKLLPVVNEETDLAPSPSFNTLAVTVPGQCKDPSGQSNPTLEPNPEAEQQVARELAPFTKEETNVPAAPSFDMPPLAIAGASQGKEPNPEVDQVKDDDAMDVVKEEGECLALLSRLSPDEAEQCPECQALPSTPVQLGKSAASGGLWNSDLPSSPLTVMSTQEPILPREEKEAGDEEEGLGLPVGPELCRSARVVVTKKKAI